MYFTSSLNVYLFFYLFIGILLGDANINKHMSSFFYLTVYLFLQLNLKSKMFAYQTLPKHSTNAKPCWKCVLDKTFTRPPVESISDFKMSTWFCFRFITVSTVDEGEVTDCWRVAKWTVLGLAARSARKQRMLVINFICSSLFFLLNRNITKLQLNLKHVLTKIL